MRTTITLDGVSFDADLEDGVFVPAAPPTPQVQAAIDRGCLLGPVRGSWRLASVKAVPVPPPGLLARAASLALALASGSADEATVALRRASCFAPCPELVTVAGKNYCGRCGCGHHPLAELDRKLRFARLDCPLKRAGFSNSE